MKFTSDDVVFGRHQTFAVRYGWLSKGFQAVKRDPGVFRSEQAIELLGVGKNMVESIGYWLRAFQLLEKNSYNTTELGDAIFRVRKGYDPYLEDEATIWLLHWLLVSNPSQATSWYWFFNCFHKPEFSGAELQTALTDFIRDRVKEGRRPAQNTIKNDAALLPRMYTQSKLHKHMPIEEMLDSPLALLRLVTQMPDGRGFQSKPASRPGLPISILAFALLQLFEAKRAEVFAIEDLMYSRDDYPAPGAVFRLTESDLLKKLEQCVDLLPGVFEINETAGIHQLYKTGYMAPMDVLEQHYAKQRVGEAA